MAADKTILPKTEKYDAVHYMLGEWDALMNIFKRGDYHLDNNDIYPNFSFIPTFNGLYSNKLIS